MAMGFKEAFRAARADGKKVFTWNGTSYNTKMASDTPTPPKRPREASGPSTSEMKWADPGAKENGRPRDDEPAPRKKMEGWADPGAMENEKRATGSYKRGGMVKKPSGPATIGVTRSNRMYAKGGMVKKGCK